MRRELRLPRVRRQVQSTAREPDEDGRRAVGGGHAPQGLSVGIEPVLKPVELAERLSDLAGLGTVYFHPDGMFRAIVAVADPVVPPRRIRLLLAQRCVEVDAAGETVAVVARDEAAMRTAKSLKPRPMGLGDRRPDLVYGVAALIAWPSPAAPCRPSHAGQRLPIRPRQPCWRNWSSPPFAFSIVIGAWIQP